MKMTKGRPVMEKRARDNRIFAGFSPRASVAAIFALGILLGALSGVLSDAPAFSAVTVFVLSAMIFMLARDILPVCGILLPCLFELTMTGNLALPALYIGFTFTVGATAYLAIGRRGIAPIIAGAVGYAAAAFIRDPMTALLVLVPILLGLIAGLMLPRFSLTETVSSMTILLLSAALITFLALGGSLSATADLLRNSIVDLCRSFNEKVFIIEEAAAEVLATYLINILPGIIFAAASVICFVSCSLTTSLLRSSGLDTEIPDDMRRLRLSPVSGIIFILCFLLSAAFSIEGGEFEIAAAAADNLLVALILPFAASGCAYGRELLANRVFASSLHRAKISAAAIALLVLFSPSVALAVFAILGVYNSLNPITSAIVKKIRSFGQNQ